MDRDLLRRYGLQLESLVHDILAVDIEPSPQDATDIYSLLHVHRITVLLLRMRLHIRLRSDAFNGARAILLLGCLRLLFGPFRL